MKKISVLLLVAIIMMLLLPTRALASSASFSITGPSTLATGQTGTYTVKVTVTDAAAAQATLVYDGSFFELVSGNPTGVWDVAANTSTTETLVSVQLKCIAATGTSGSLSLSNYKVSRLTGSIPPSEAVSVSGASKNVSNPVPTPSPIPTVAPTATPSPTPGPTSAPKPTATPKPTSSAPTVTPEVSGTIETTEPDISPSATETGQPSPTPKKELDWPDVLDMLDGLEAGGSLQIDMTGKTKVPFYILDALKSIGGILEVNFGNYICLIDGSMLKDSISGFSILDLEVSMAKDIGLSQAAGGLDIYQLHFNYHGELPGLFIYTVMAADSQPGDTLYLYYNYEQAGIIEGMQSAVVSEDGTVTFTFYHCSSYFVTDTIVEGAMNNFTQSGAANSLDSESSPGGIPIWVFIICLLGIAIISAMATMLAGKSGFFKPKTN